MRGPAAGAAVIEHVHHPAGRPATPRACRIQSEPHSHAQYPALADALIAFYAAYSVQLEPAVQTELSQCMLRSLRASATEAFPLIFMLEVHNPRTASPHSPVQALGKLSDGGDGWTVAELPHVAQLVGVCRKSINQPAKALTETLLLTALQRHFRAARTADARDALADTMALFNCVQARCLVMLLLLLA